MAGELAANMEPGDRVGSYVLERRLGSGGMGEVWLGRHAVSGGLGAVKVLRPGIRDPAKILRYFHREGRTVMRLRHPHIVAVFELGERHLVCQYVDGQDLARRLQSPMDPAQALRLARQIAAALAHAHAAGLVHRDVKPANILLDKAGNAFLADFGLAIPADDEAESSVRAGTPAYMAPEQARGDVIGPAADQYALGRTLAEMLVGGKLPADPALALGELPAHLPAALRQLLERATQPDPKARFPDMAALAAALDAVDVSAYPPPVRLAPEVRLRAPYGWCTQALGIEEVAPDIARADHRLRQLAEARALPPDDVDALLAETGYADLGFSVYGSTARLGPLADPASLARASELVVLLHGWVATREVWRNVAAAICRDNAQAIVLTPDLWGFGESPWKGTPSRTQLRLPGIVVALQRLLALLRVRDLPTVLVGHSLSAVGVLSIGDEDVGPRTARIAINPVFPAYSEDYRARIRMGVRLAQTVGRVPGLRKVFLRKMVMDAPAGQELALDVREGMARNALALTAAVLPRMFDALLAVPRLRGFHNHRALLLIGQNDPLVSEDALAKAIEDLQLHPSQFVRLATGGHYPHLETAAHPEWTARNVAEIVYLVTTMMLTSHEGTLLSTAIESTMIGDTGASGQGAGSAGASGAASARATEPRAVAASAGDTPLPSPASVVRSGDKP